MKNKTAKKPAAATISQAVNSSEEHVSPVAANSKHHKKPKKQYL